MLACALLVILVLSLGGEYLARQIPFATEVEWVQDLDESLPPGNPQRSAYLQRLADRLLEKHPLPEGMTVTVHYDAADTVNAYATLGGHIVIYQGLWDFLASENALAMVLAHEIAHVRERHPIESLGRTAAVSLVMAVISSAAGGGGVDLLSSAGTLTMLQFSRSQEAAADVMALAMVNDLYGHVAGADDFFEQMQSDHPGVSDWVPEFVLTHPLHEGRLAMLAAEAARHGWVRQGELVALPR